MNINWQSWLELRDDIATTRSLLRAAWMREQQRAIMQLMRRKESAARARLLRKGVSR